MVDSKYKFLISSEFSNESHISKKWEKQIYCIIIITSIFFINNYYHNALMFL